MKTLVGLLVGAGMLWGLAVPVTAQEPPKTLTLRTATLIPFAKDKSVKGALLLDLHAKPPATRDTWYKTAWDLIARHTALTVGIAGSTPADMFDIAKANTVGVSAEIPLVEGRLGVGAVWLADEGAWYGTVNLVF